MPNDLHDCEAGSLARGRWLIVEGPGDEDGDDGEEADAGGVDGGVADGGGEEVWGEAEQEVAEGGEQRVEDEEGGARVVLVGEVGG